MFFNIKFPSISETVPVFVPTTAMLANGMGCLFDESKTLPFNT